MLDSLRGSLRGSRPCLLVTGPWVQPSFRSARGMKMSDNVSSEGMQLNRSLLVGGGVLVGVGGLLGLTGMVLVGSALLSATRQWVKQLEQPPSVMARRSGSRPRWLPLRVPGHGGTDPRAGRSRPRQASSGGGTGLAAGSCRPRPAPNPPVDRHMRRA
jgi:hypothetical protein